MAPTPSLLDRLDPRDYETVARLIMPDPVLSWIDSGVIDVSDNAAAFARRRVLARVLGGANATSAETTVLGRSVASPIGVAPIGLMKALHPDGEIAAATAAAAAGAIHVVGVNATTPIGEVAAAVPEAELWLQLYNWPDHDALAEVVGRAEEAGCRAIVVLVNTPVPVAHVPARAGFGLPPGAELAHGAAGHGLEADLGADYVSWLASITDLPVVVKGVLHPDDAERAVAAGASAVWISNHGGRQVPRSIATLDALPSVAAAVGDRAEVYLDGGVRSGYDALIAIALGARAVFIGRHACWGLAVGGAEGLERMLTSMRDELIEAAAMCGLGSLADADAGLVVDRG